MEYLDSKGLEVKLVQGQDEGKFEGMAAVFDKKDRGADIILPGAFTKSLHKHPARRVKMLRQHDQTQMLGIWDSFEETKEGLFAKGHLLMDLPAAKEVFILMKEGILDALSIGFMTIIDSWDSDKSARILHEVSLLETSLVAIPMQPDALITGVKSLDLQTKTDLERALRNAGFSRSTAKYICSGWTAPARRNDEGDNDADLLGHLKTLRDTIQLA